MKDVMNEEIMYCHVCGELITPDQKFESMDLENGEGQIYLHADNGTYKDGIVVEKSMLSCFEHYITRRHNECK